MKRFQNVTAAILIGFTVFCTPLVVVPTLTSCASVDPSANNLIVYAERAETICFETINTFLKFEYDNRATLVTKAPAVTQVADLIRVNWPPAFDKLHAALLAYKSNRTAANQSALVQALAVVEAQKTRAQEIYAAALAP